MTSALPTRVRRIVREVVVSLISIVVLAYVAGELTAATPQRVFAVGVVSTAAAPAETLVFFGKVVDRSTGKAVRGATVTTVKVRADGSFEQLAVTSTAADGTFRTELAPASAGTYKLLFEANPGQGVVRDAFSVDATPGRTYGVLAELIDREYFTLLPLPGY